MTIPAWVRSPARPGSDPPDPTVILTGPVFRVVLADGSRFTFSNTGGQDLRITMGDYWKRRIVFTGSSTGVLTSVLAFQIHHGNLYMWLTGGAIGGAWGGQYFMILDPHGNLVADEHMDYGNLGADDARQLRHFAVDPNGQVW